MWWKMYTDREKFLVSLWGEYFNYFKEVETNNDKEFISCVGWMCDRMWTTFLFCIDKDGKGKQKNTLLNMHVNNPLYMYVIMLESLLYINLFHMLSEHIWMKECIILWDGVLMLVILIILKRDSAKRWKFRWDFL